MATKKASDYALTPEEIDALTAKLRAKDLMFADQLHDMQERDIPKIKLKDIRDFSEAEKLKRLILDMHEGKSVVEHKGLTLNLIKFGDKEGEDG